jgi:hypothetical protein
MKGIFIFGLQLINYKQTVRKGIPNWNPVASRAEAVCSAP